MSLINNVEIKNFKSIKELSFSTKRVNVFVGKPNVGKSNILEALSLFCAGYMAEGLLTPFVRFNFIQELFFRKNVREPIYINTDIGALNLGFFVSNAYFLMIDPLKKLAKDGFTSTYSTLGDVQSFFNEKYRAEQIAPFDLHPLFLSLGNSINKNTKDEHSASRYYSPIKRYSFKEFSNEPTSFFYPYSLIPPYGSNIVTILYDNRELLSFFAEIFKEEYNLELTIKDPEQVLEVVIREDLISISTPINLVADTLQRIMFYLTAIKSNKNSVLLLEEPEANSFPTYTNMLADNIANDKDNQYFITTHSPYLLRTLLDETPKDEIGIFITTYKNHQTHLHALTGEEISELLDYNIDLFFNYKKFVD